MSHDFLKDYDKGDLSIHIQAGIGNMSLSLIMIKTTPNRTHKKLTLIWSRDNTQAILPFTYD